MAIYEGPFNDFNEYLTPRYNSIIKVFFIS